MSVQRWNEDRDGATYEHPLGEFVRYTDHAAIVTEMQKRIDEMTKALAGKLIGEGLEMVEK